jgi:hypothetical protein
MLAKSLVIFISVGVLAGFLYGVYLVDFKNTNQLVYVDGPSISIVTEKSDFKKGEEIKIRIVNSGTTQLKFSDDSYLLRITGLAGMTIYEPNQKITTLEPGKEIEYVWNQIKINGDPALEGLYKLSTKSYTSDGTKVEKSITLNIWK